MSLLLDIKKITYTEFRQMEFDDNEPAHLYELINGEIMRRASPNADHQFILGNLYAHLRAFVRTNDLGKVAFAPLDVRLDDENAPQPDLIFVQKDREHIIKRRGCIEGVPDLLVEIVSRGSITRDRITKKSLYEGFGVREYWIIEQGGSVEINVLERGVYKLHLLANEGVITSKLLKGFSMTIDDLFE